MSFLIFLLLLIKPAYRIGIQNCYTFRWLYYLGPVPKSFGTDTFTFLSRNQNQTGAGILFLEKPEPIPRNLQCISISTMRFTIYTMVYCGIFVPIASIKVKPTKDSYNNIIYASAKTNCRNCLYGNRT